MLYDQKRDMNLQGFADFCASKDPGEMYVYVECEKCAVGQWLEHIGMKLPLSEWCDTPGVKEANAIAALSPHTFGALRERVMHCIGA